MYCSGGHLVQGHLMEYRINLKNLMWAGHGGDNLKSQNVRHGHRMIRSLRPFWSRAGDSDHLWLHSKTLSQAELFMVLYAYDQEADMG